MKRVRQKNKNKKNLKISIAGGFVSGGATMTQQEKAEQRKIMSNMCYTPKKDKKDRKVKHKKALYHDDYMG